VPDSGYSLDELRQHSDDTSWSRLCFSASPGPSPSPDEPVVGEFAVAALYERRKLLNQKPAVTDRRSKKAKVTHYRRNRASHCTFARSAPQCFGASNLALHIAAGGGSLGFRHQLLRLSNGFRFLRIRACSDLSSFTCVGHSSWSLLSSMQGVQPCTNPPPSLEPASYCAAGP